VPARQPVTTPLDDRSPAAKAYQWATRIMVVSLEMVLPGLAGLWLDRWLGSLIVFTLLGFAAGSWVGVTHLIRMTRSDQSRRDSRVAARNVKAADKQ
jgi:hypothetical protein